MSRSYGFLSSYPPTQCGLATFTASLRAEVANLGCDTGVVRVMAQREASADEHVVEQMVHGEANAAKKAAVALNAFDVAVVQHEFGIYAGDDGAQVIDVLDDLTVPSIVVLHTVLVTPTEHQRAVLEAVARRATVLVTMTDTARGRLIASYDIDVSKIVLIPHGAPDGGAAKVRRDPPKMAAERPVLLTWGLLGPGKGIERVIDALPGLVDLVPRPLYLVVGDTHPRVVEREGERYRDSLIARAQRLGVADMVSFRSGYLDGASLRAITAAADLVVLPYDSRDQVTSGVLIEAVAACRPVIATAFAHAVELLATGAGIVVDHDDPAALLDAIRLVLCEPAQAAAMTAQASLLAPDLLWPAVAARYCALASDMPGARAEALA